MIRRWRNPSTGFRGNESPTLTARDGIDAAAPVPRNDRTTGE